MRGRYPGDSPSVRLTLHKTSELRAHQLALRAIVGYIIPAELSSNVCESHRRTNIAVST